MNKKWAYLVSSMATMLFMGVLYTWSILKTPFAREFAWSAGQLGLNFTCTVSVFSLGVFAGGQLVGRVKERWLLLLSAVLVCAGFCGCSFLTGGSVIPLYLLYGCVSGFGIGVAYNVIVSATLSWFDDMRGLCSGMLMMCFGASTLLLGTCASSMFQSIGWRTTFRVFGEAIAIAMLSSAVILRSNPEQRRSAASTGTDVYKKMSFWLFFLFIIALSAGASMVVSFSRDISLDVGAGEALATTLVGVLAICNGLGRLLCGFLSDRFSVTKVMMIAGGLAAAAACALLYAVSAHQVFAVIIGMCATGIAYGFAPTVISGFVAKTYGMEHFSINFSLASFTLIPCSFAATVGGVMVTKSGGFQSTLILSAILAAISIALAVATGKSAARDSSRA